MTKYKSGYGNEQTEWTDTIAEFLEIIHDVVTKYPDQYFEIRWKVPGRYVLTIWSNKRIPDTDRCEYGDLIIDPEIIWPTFYEIMTQCRRTIDKYSNYGKID